MDTLINKLTRSELIDQIRASEIQLRDLQLKQEPPEQAKQDIQEQLKEDLKNAITQMKDAFNNMPVPNQPALTSKDTFNEYVMATKKQTIFDSIKNVGKLNSASVDTWISHMDAIYNIDIIEDNALEPSFIKGVKRTLNPTQLSTLTKSGKDVSTWAKFKAYLLDSYGSKISVFQHLHNLWNLELREGESITSYGSRVEQQIHSAKSHIKKVFSSNNNNAEMDCDAAFNLFGAMLTSLQIKQSHNSIYRQMLRNMDKHWDSNSLSGEAQNLYDRLGPDPEHHTYMMTNKKPSFDSKQHQLTKSGQVKPKNDENRLNKLRKKVQDQICFEFQKTGKCRYGERCFRKHIKQEKVYYGNIPESNETSRDEQHDDESYSEPTFNEIFQQ